MPAFFICPLSVTDPEPVEGLPPAPNSRQALSEVEWVGGLHALFHQRNSKVLSEVEEIDALSKLGAGR